MADQLEQSKIRNFFRKVNRTPNKSDGSDHDFRFVRKGDGLYIYVKVDGIWWKSPLFTKG